MDISNERCEILGHFWPDDRREIDAVRPKWSLGNLCIVIYCKFEVLAEFLPLVCLSIFHGRYPIFLLKHVLEIGLGRKAKVFADLAEGFVAVSQ